MTCISQQSLLARDFKTININERSKLLLITPVAISATLLHRWALNCLARPSHPIHGLFWASGLIRNSETPDRILRHDMAPALVEVLQVFLTLSKHQTRLEGQNPQLKHHSALIRYNCKISGRGRVQKVGDLKGAEACGAITTASLICTAFRLCWLLTLDCQ